MAKWGATDAGYKPLFDRLVDEAPKQRQPESTPARTLDLEELKVSVAKELETLLSTRCTVSGDVALSRPRTILDYGMPDLDQGGKTIVSEDRMRLIRLIRETIEAFEPRLRNLSVEVEQDQDERTRLLVNIDGLLLIEDVREPISFQMPLGAG
ncbi:MAG: type VI secretion system baseplate subunit TssE [Byssovorax sp.]